MDKGASRARICCLDLDTFFVSVERLHRPELIGQPVVVGATPGKRGVVTAASYEVRAFGVRSGMPIAEAVRRAPHAFYLPARHGEYAEHAGRVKAILERYTPIVQTASIDEFFLDFRHCERLHSKPGDRDADAGIERAVREMRQCIQDELGLPASAGVAATRAMAKIASGLAKPAGVVMVLPGKELGVTEPLPVRKFPGIGPVTETALQAEGIETLGQLLALETERPGSRFDSLARSVRRGLEGSGSRPELGRDRPAFREHDPEGLSLGSISNEQTFEIDVGDSQALEDQLRLLSERVCWRARKRQIAARTVTLKLRYSDFTTLNRSRTIAATNADKTVFECVRRLFRAARSDGRKVRLLGVGLSNLTVAERQLELPFSGAERASIGEAIDAVRKRYGYDAIHLGLKKSKRGWLG